MRITAIGMGIAKNVFYAVARDARHKVVNERMPHQQSGITEITKTERDQVRIEHTRKPPQT